MIETINTGMEFWVRRWNSSNILSLNYSFTLQYEIKEIVYDIEESCYSKINCVLPSNIDFENNVAVGDYVVFYVGKYKKFAIIKKYTIDEKKISLEIGFDAECVNGYIFFGDPDVVLQGSIKSRTITYIQRTFTNPSVGSLFYGIPISYDVNAIPQNSNDISSIEVDNGVITFSDYVNQVCRIYKLNFRVDFVGGMITMVFYTPKKTLKTVDCVEQDIVLGEPDMQENDKVPNKLTIYGYNGTSYINYIFYTTREGIVSDSANLLPSEIIEQVIYDKKSFDYAEAKKTAISKMERKFNTEITMNVSDKFFEGYEFVELLNCDVDLILKSKKAMYSKITRITLSQEGTYEIKLGSIKQRLTSKLKQIGVGNKV